MLRAARDCGQIVRPGQPACPSPAETSETSQCKGRFSNRTGLLAWLCGSHNLAEFIDVRASLIETIVSVLVLDDGSVCRPLAARLSWPSPSLQDRVVTAAAVLDVVHQLSFV